MSTQELSRTKSAIDKSTASLALEFGHAWDYAPAPEAKDHVRIQPRYDLFVGGRWTAPKPSRASMASGGCWLKTWSRPCKSRRKTTRPWTAMRFAARTSPLLTCSCG